MFHRTLAFHSVWEQQQQQEEIKRILLCSVHDHRYMELLIVFTTYPTWLLWLGSSTCVSLSPSVGKPGWWDWLHTGSLTSCLPLPHGSWGDRLHCNTMCTGKRNTVELHYFIHLGTCPYCVKESPRFNLHCKKVCLEHVNVLWIQRCLISVDYLRPKVETWHVACIFDVPDLNNPIWSATLRSENT